MKKTILAFMALLMVSFGARAQETKTLPEPNKDVPMTLMQALQQRHSVREFSEQEITDQQLSQILWAACGVSRPEKKMITAPSAGNRQDIHVYVCGKDGAWLYEPFTNTLKKVSSEDLRAVNAGRQESVKYAPLSLVLVSDQSNADHLDTNLGNVDAGYVSQNIYLASTALGLATVARGFMDKATVAKALNLGDKQLLVLNHPLGYAK